MHSSTPQGFPGDLHAAMGDGELYELLMNITGWDKPDTYMYMFIQSDVQINQACKPCSLFMDLRFGIPKLPGLKPLIG